VGGKASMMYERNFADASPLILRGFEYWQMKAGVRSMPSWADISPADIKDLLPNVVVTHVQQNPLDFVERVTGGEILKHSGVNTKAGALTVPSGNLFKMSLKVRRQALSLSPILVLIKIS
jgi:PAS domain-containing protein